jgi:hypothetical protein
MAQQFDVYDITLRPVKGNLSIGVDPVEVWSTSPSVLPVNTWTDMLTFTFEPRVVGQLLEVYFYLKYRVRAPVSVTADVDERVQARNKGLTDGWLNISDELATANIGTAWITRITSGWVMPTRNPDYTVAGVRNPNFFLVPFDIRVQMRTNEENEGRLEVSSLSYIRALFRGR